MAGERFTFILILPLNRKNVSPYKQNQLSTPVIGTWITVSHSLYSSLLLSIFQLLEGVFGRWLDSKCKAKSIRVISEDRVRSLKRSRLEELQQNLSQSYVNKEKKHEKKFKRVSGLTVCAVPIPFQQDIVSSHEIKAILLITVDYKLANSDTKE